MFLNKNTDLESAFQWNLGEPDGGLGGSGKRRQFVSFSLYITYYKKVS